MQFLAGNRLIEAEEIRFAPEGAPEALEAVFGAEAFKSVLDEQYCGSGEVQAYEGCVAQGRMLIDEITLQGGQSVVRLTPVASRTVH
ncbi:hypothetical protein [Albirhodobacter sp. R86504]|uniref:hypothetical protein n=1 Tax=Albirhodobacter sp. R86504 TaxID=3093848 RepID=UPI003671BFB6